MSKPAVTKPESEVNAYLFYSARLLHLLNSSLLIEQQADKMALTASVCLSLKQAWQSWLKELSGYVGKEISDYSSLFLEEHKYLPEVECLLNVTKQQHNWLSLMLTYFEPRLNVPAKQASSDDEQENTVSLTRISALQVDDLVELSDEERLKSVISEFKSYISTVRSRQAEW